MENKKEQHEPRMNSGAPKYVENCLLFNSYKLFLSVKFKYNYETFERLTVLYYNRKLYMPILSTGKEIKWEGVGNN